MKTLLLDDGDLVLNSGAFEEVTGRTKLTQDLSLAMREPYGVDRFHTRWGSLLPNYVGEPSNDRTALLIEAEARRLVQNTMAIQKDNITRDASAGNASRYGSGEVIQSVGSIKVRQEYDVFHVRVALDTLSSDEVVIISTVRD